MIKPMPSQTPPRVDDARQRIVLVTGPSGAGRSTAINALEDLGFEVIDNLPLSLLARLMDGPPLARPVALGLDVRNRDFGVDALIDTIDQLAAREDVDDQVLYIDCAEDELVRRYSETRRRHPLSPDTVPLVGIRQELELLVPIRARAHVLIDSSGISPHDLRSEIADGFGVPSGQKLGMTVQSFSFKRGLPRGLDMIQDVRFLRNPHWDAKLRGLDGRDADVGRYIADDPRFTEYFDKLCDMIMFLLPAYRDEGKTHLSVGIGCTGGQHRSVYLTERLAESLAQNGWQVSKRHREMERRATALAGMGTQGANR